MSAMIEVKIDSVRVSLMSVQRVVVLQEKDAERYLPIWVGPAEAEAITVALQEVEVARPLTHDLLKNALTRLGGRLVRVEIIALKDDIFYGQLMIEQEGKELGLDARPSDAIALAVRAHVPILVARDVMETAGIVPEKDMQEGSMDDLESGGEEEHTLEPPTPVDEERLDVFEDFLKNLGNDRGEEGGKAQDPEGPQG